MSQTLSMVTAVASPVAAAVASAVGVYFTRKSAVDIDKRRSREESMRMLRWSVELALKEGGQSAAGVTALASLADSEMLQPEDQEMINAMFEKVAEQVLTDSDVDYAEPIGSVTGEEDGHG